jgi:hypothetical protein
MVICYLQQDQLLISMVNCTKRNNNLSKIRSLTWHKRKQAIPFKYTTPAS